MGYYRRHIFFCCNLREDGRQCCQAAGATEARAYAKERIKALGLAGTMKQALAIEGRAASVSNAWRGREMVLAEFNEDILADKTEQLYYELLNIKMDKNK